ncbi:MAG: type III-A CRISPR-associated protein Csm2 [Chloroflexi bacterium HGW-Chloroflexi-1]|nr:MAG: type III-A CRISPR-associated protein Csm2 [Chloroflexi bacterium HGW-Chloroflexi-1]
MVKNISPQDVEKIIGGDVRVLVQEAERFGRELAEDKLSKSQIRGVFGTVRQIGAAWESTAKSDPRQNLRKVLLLKPRLAYQARRGDKVKPLAEVLTYAINLVAKPDDPNEQTRRFGYFVDLFEAILAYHTAYEKKGEGGQHGS